MTDRIALRRLVAELDDRATALITVIGDMDAEDTADTADMELLSQLEDLAAMISDWQEAKGYI